MISDFLKDNSFFFNDYSTAQSYKIEYNDNNTVLFFVAPGFKKEQFLIENRFDKLYVTIPEQRQKTLILPDNVDLNDISAEYKAGILKIKLRLKKFKKNKIEIK